MTVTLPGGAIETETVLVWLTGGDSESVTVTSKVKVPWTRGVPWTVPSGARPRPAGSTPPPGFVQAYGATPPTATRFAEYGVPKTPQGSCWETSASGTPTEPTCMLRS